MQTKDVRHAALILFLLSGISFAQTTAKSNPPNSTKAATASVTGKAFIITKAGDVKPALLAHVRLFAVKHPIARYTLQSVAMFDEHAQKMREIAESNGFPGRSDSILEDECRYLLHDLETVKVTSLKDQAGSDLPTYSADTDETGAFSVTHIEPGVYLLMVHGQAGSYEALWIDKVTFVGGETKTLKLSSPAEACPIK